MGCPRIFHWLQRVFDDFSFLRFAIPYFITHMIKKEEELQYIDEMIQCIPPYMLVAVLQEERIIPHDEKIFGLVSDFDALLRDQCCSEAEEEMKKERINEKEQEKQTKNEITKEKEKEKDKDQEKDFDNKSNDSSSSQQSSSSSSSQQQQYSDLPINSPLLRRAIQIIESQSPLTDQSDEYIRNVWSVILKCFIDRFDATIKEIRERKLKREKEKQQDRERRQKERERKREKQKEKDKEKEKQKLKEKEKQIEKEQGKEQGKEQEKEQIKEQEKENKKKRPNPYSVNRASKQRAQIPVKTLNKEEEEEEEEKEGKGKEGRINN
ncbi:MAG: hypothetical protein EZS28_034449 [Streblomastix strix]|uniref:Uncharacterized protein n=1 Tax=Streblomastix strix TaxID=222440 RepID=A0A5J4UIL1_9EUKA|nr:MAG: hypothetical protein EZS28_034449 [Streblomastix strix]